MTPPEGGPEGKGQHCRHRVHEVAEDANARRVAEEVVAIEFGNRKLPSIRGLHHCHRSIGHRLRWRRSRIVVGNAEEKLPSREYRLRASTPK
jgi:hypothetical protein